MDPKFRELGFFFFFFVLGNPTLEIYKGERCGPHILRLMIFFPL